MNRFIDFTANARTQMPEIGMVLGSGMGPIAQQLTHTESIPFAEVPDLSTGTSVAGHKGCLTLGDWQGRRVLLFEGRLHYYEGYPWRLVTQPVRIASLLGVKKLILTNAAGGIHPQLEPGSLMAIRDHFEWNRPYSWRTPGPGGLAGDRTSPYSASLLTHLRASANVVKVPLLAGVYACLTGPCYETPAEIRALQTCGADAVGMSTAREVQTAHELGIECVGISCVTNRAAGLSDAVLDHKEVLEQAKGAVVNLAKLLTEFLPRLT